VEVFLGAAHELMDTSLAADVRAAVIAEVRALDGVNLTGVAGRTIGDITLVEVHADVDPAMSAGQAGAITDEIKRRLIANVPDVNHVVVELNSSEDEPAALRV
jgi:divalent metal cation (Fe/Co/Zn/Cd) transporter